MTPGYSSSHVLARANIFSLRISGTLMAVVLPDFHFGLFPDPVLAPPQFGFRLLILFSQFLIPIIQDDFVRSL